MEFRNPITSLRVAFANVALKLAVKAAGVVTPVRTALTLQQTGNPVRGLTPESLISHLDAYRMGRIRDAAKVWDIQEQVDDTLRTVSRKARGDVSRLPWEIVEIENADESKAQRHREVLLDFYNTLRVTDALHRDVRGGVRLLVTQMMDAIGKGYAVHETVWRPSPGKLRAEFQFLPLWYFEGTQGQLRFLESDWEMYGRDLEPGGWLVTAVADPLMLASSLAVLFKGLPLRAWLMFIEKFSVPGVLGTTDAPVGSAERTALEDAVASLVNDWAAVKGRGDEIALLEVKNSGALPHPPLIEYLDRKIITLWRGADLATASRGGDAVGASIQEDETDLLTEDWASMISETLNDQIDRLVLAWHFGEDVEPCAFFRMCPPRRRNVELDLKVDDAFLRWGIPLGVDAAYERYNRPPPQAGEDTVRGPSQPAAAVPSQPPEDADLANTREPALSEADLARLRSELRQSIAADIDPLRKRVERICRS